jgi:hypothetical protein
MPYIETVNELVENLADMCDIYCYQCKGLDDDDEAEHIEEMSCRHFFVGDIANRMREAVKREQALAANKPNDAS